MVINVSAAHVLSAVDLSGSGEDHFPLSGSSFIIIPYLSFILIFVLALVCLKHHVH